MHSLQGIIAMNRPSGKAKNSKPKSVKKWIYRNASKVGCVKVVSTKSKKS